MAFGKKDDGLTVIKPANIVRTTIQVQGTAPFVQCKFSEKAKKMMMDTMSTPKAAKKSRTERPPRDYDEEFKEAQHLSTEGWHGIPAPAFRAAMIDACRLTGLVMTRAKMSVFVVADGLDIQDGTPLVRLYSPKPPEKHQGLVRLESGVADIRIRPMWREWDAKVTVEFDADMITPESVVNLLDRAGRQVGVGEGRPYSKNSCGQGWGTFMVTDAKENENE